MRVKNEARWIERCVSSILPLCDRVLLMDDNSDDGTGEICRKLPGVTVFDSPFDDLNETRDKNWLLGHALRLHNPEWIVFTDGDEMLAPGSIDPLRAAMNPAASCLSLRVLYLWDAENQVRVDGVYGDFHRESIFRPNDARFESNGNGGNFHCGNVPWANRFPRQVLDIPLLHFGYLHREDRLRKFAWYNAQQPVPESEDGYRHVVVGDLFPADSVFCHGGPLKLKSI